MGLRIVQTQGQNLEMTCWAVGFEFRQICAAIPNFANDRSTFIFNPDGGAA